MVRILKDLQEDTGRHVLIVEDIIDTGLTLSYLRRSLLRASQPPWRSALLSKPSRRQIDLDVKYVGFEVPDEFVVGYGIDFAGAYRNLLRHPRPEARGAGNPRSQPSSQRTDEDM